MEGDVLPERERRGRARLGLRGLELGRLASAPAVVGIAVGWAPPIWAPGQRVASAGRPGRGRASSRPGLASVFGAGAGADGAWGAQAAARGTAPTAIRPKRRTARRVSRRPFGSEWWDSNTVPASSGTHARSSSLKHQPRGGCATKHATEPWRREHAAKRRPTVTPSAPLHPPPRLPPGRTARGFDAETSGPGALSARVRDVSRNRASRGAWRQPPGADNGALAELIGVLPCEARRVLAWRSRARWPW